VINPLIVSVRFLFAEACALDHSATMRDRGTNRLPAGGEWGELRNEKISASRKRCGVRMARLALCCFDVNPTDRNCHGSVMLVTLFRDAPAGRSSLVGGVAQLPSGAVNEREIPLS